MFGPDHPFSQVMSDVSQEFTLNLDRPGYSAYVEHKEFFKWVQSEADPRSAICSSLEGSRSFHYELKSYTPLGTEARP